jgi:hypothetical protein
MPFKAMIVIIASAAIFVNRRENTAGKTTDIRGASVERGFPPASSLTLPAPRFVMDHPRSAVARDTRRKSSASIRAHRFQKPSRLVDRKGIDGKRRQRLASH